MSRVQFRSLFCERFHCAASEYEARAFKACLYWHARLVAPLIEVFDPDFFKTDKKFIRYLGEATGFREALEDRGNFHHANSSNRSLLRTVCKVRVSGPKATRLAKALFSDSRPRETVEG